MYIDTGSTVNLTCIVHGLNEPPTSILWTHNGYVSFISSLPSTFTLCHSNSLTHSIFRLSKEINYDSPRGGVSVITEKSDITTSYLLIQRAKPADSGKYICRWNNCHNYQSSDFLTHFPFFSHTALRMPIQRAYSYTFWTVGIKRLHEHLLCRRCSQYVWNKFLFSSLRWRHVASHACLHLFIQWCVAKKLITDKKSRNSNEHSEQA